MLSGGRRQGRPLQTVARILGSLAATAVVIVGCTSVTWGTGPELRDALGAWVGAARDVAGTITRDAGPGEFNAAVTRLNASREVALELCDASY